MRFPINKLIYTKMFHYFHGETVNSCSSLLLVGYIPTAWGLSWEAAEELDKKDHILQACRCQTHAPSHKFPIFTELPEKSTTFSQPQPMNKLKNPIQLKRKTGMSHFHIKLDGGVRLTHRWKKSC